VDGGGAFALESEMLEWLEMHAQDVTGIHGVHGWEAELSLLRDSWTDIDLHALHQCTAWGDHSSLAAVLSMLSERGCPAQAYVYDSRGEDYDGMVCAHDIYGVKPAMTLQLAFVRGRRFIRGT